MMTNVVLVMVAYLLLSVTAVAGELKGTPALSKDGVQRTVIHTDAYKTKVGAGPHLNIKVTPASTVGRPGFVLVEVYNYSKRYLALADFWLVLRDAAGTTVEANVTCDDIKGGWSGLKWIKLPHGAKKLKVVKVDIVKMKMFTESAKPLKLKWTVDLING